MEAGSKQSFAYRLLDMFLSREEVHRMFMLTQFDIRYKGGSDSFHYHNQSKD